MYLQTNAEDETLLFDTLMWLYERRDHYRIMLVDEMDLRAVPAEAAKGDLEELSVRREYIKRLSSSPEWAKENAHGVPILARALIESLNAWRKQLFKPELLEIIEEAQVAGYWEGYLETYAAIGDAAGKRDWKTFTAMLWRAKGQLESMKAQFATEVPA